MLTPIENLIGSHHTFFSDLLHRLKKFGITFNGFPLSHFTYRTYTQQEYLGLREAIKNYCDEYVETQFNGRAVAILILKNPL